MANKVDLDKVADKEPPHQDLRCLQIQLFSALVVKELIWSVGWLFWGGFKVVIITNLGQRQKSA